MQEVKRRKRIGSRGGEEEEDWCRRYIGKREKTGAGGGEEENRRKSCGEGREDRCKNGTNEEDMC